MTATLLTTMATLFAQGAPPAVTPRPPRPAGESSSDATLRLRGTITSYDRETRLLSLSTSSGVVRFEVPETARIRLGGRHVERRRLTTLRGYVAAVHFSAIGGHTTLRSVDVFDAHERTRP
jgi:hypothetical protein